ncbi:MAG: MFS transporter [Planctomycetaceae bacterium]
MKQGVNTRLSIMMFLQFFLWGAWFATLGKCLADNSLGSLGAGAYGSAPLAAMIAPLFLGLIADRFFPSQIVMGVLLVIGGIVLALAPGAAETAKPFYAVVVEASEEATAAAKAAEETPGDKELADAVVEAEAALIDATDAAAPKGKVLVWLFIAHMLCYMPTLGLSNTIAFTNISDQNDFPKIRVWGTIGWIVAGLIVGFMGWSASFNMFYLAAASSVLLGVFSFTLPHTPPPAKDKPLDIKTLFMVDALKLMADPPFFVFVLCSTLICIPLAYYYGLTSNLLGQVGFDAPASTMTIGQMSEIFFMLLIPFFFRRLGVKWMIVVGMATWVLRYVLFAFGAAHQQVWMILLAVAVHGICYDFFFVTGFMYTDAKAPKEIRGQAQSLLVFLTQGVGMYFGYMVAYDQFDKTLGSYADFQVAIDAAKGEGKLTAIESLTRMVSVNLPETIDQNLLNETMLQWKEYWMLPAYMAGAILVLFFVAFWDSVKIDDGKGDVAAAEAATPGPEDPVTA